MSSEVESNDWATTEMPELPTLQNPSGVLSAIRMKVSSTDGIYAMMAAAAVVFVLIITAILSFALLSRVGEVILNQPHPDYIDWQTSFFELTGQDNISGLSGDGVAVCVVDTGIDMGHPDLAGANLILWHDLINEHAQPYDDQGHGTAMAGIIVANGGLHGVAPDVDLLVVKAMDASGEGDDQIIASAVDWCVDNNADVISMSLGGAPGFNFIFVNTDALESSVQSALDEGIFVVAAAGNDGENDDGDVESPGSVEDVICVGAVDRHGTIWSGSSQGDNNGELWPNPMLPRNDPDKKPELVAPGHDVPVLVANQELTPWGHASGTSASTAWVSGALALLLEAHPELQHDGSSGGTSAIEQVKDWIHNGTSHDDHYGYGVLRIDILLALSSESTSQPILTEPIGQDWMVADITTYA